MKTFLFSPCLAPMSSSFLSLPLRLPLTYICALPPFCSFCFLPHGFYRLIAVSGSSAEHSMPRGPASLPGRVMYEWLALTSLQARRHSNSVLPGLLFLVLSLSGSPLVLLYPPLITSLFFPFLLLCLLLCDGFTVSPFPASTTFSCPSFVIALAHVKTCLSSSSTLLLRPPSFWSFLFSSKAAPSPSFVYLFLSQTYKYTEA